MESYKGFFCYIEFGLKLLFIKFKEDVIYCSTPNIFACFIALIKAKIMKKKFVFEIRDDEIISSGPHKCILLQPIFLLFLYGWKKYF